MTPTDDLARLARAFDFAARAHAGQRRKGEAAEPYVNHLTDVVRRLSDSEAADADLLIAGMLHDVVEDTAQSRAEVEAEFGAAVAALVAEVTDDKALPKAERKRLQVEHAPHASAGARRIKLADKASNLASLADSPPREWDAARLREYFAWARAVVAGLRGTDAALEAAFDAEAARAEAALAGRA